MANIEDVCVALQIPLECPQECTCSDEDKAFRDEVGYCKYKEYPTGIAALEAILAKLQELKLPHKYHYFPIAPGGWKHLWVIYKFSELHDKHDKYEGKGRNILMALVAAVLAMEDKR